MSKELLNIMIDEARIMLDTIEYETASPMRKHVLDQELQKLLTSYCDVVIKLEELSKAKEDKDYLNCLTEVRDMLSTFNSNLMSVWVKFHDFAIDEKKNTEKKQKIEKFGEKFWKNLKSSETNYTLINDTLKHCQELPKLEANLTENINNLEKSLSETHKTYQKSTYSPKGKNIISKLPKLQEKTAKEIEKLKKETAKYEAAQLATIIVSFIMPIMFLLFFEFDSKAQEKKKEINKYKDQLESIKRIGEDTFEISTVKKSCNKLKESVGNLSKDFLGYNVVEAKVAHPPTKPKF